MSFERLSVLIVENDPRFRAHTSEMLKELGVHDVVAVAAADPALTQLRTREFDVLLCALKLGSESGMSVIQSAKQLSPATRAVLIAQTTASDNVAKALGATEVLTKPFTATKLELTLRRAAATSKGLWGEVQDLSLTDILQMYHHGRQSIAVLVAGPIQGRIQLLGGEIVHAESAGMQGLPALARLLSATTGVVSTEISPPGNQRTIHGRFQWVVLEALHLIDQQKRASEQASLGKTAIDANPAASGFRPAVTSLRPSRGAVAPREVTERESEEIFGTVSLPSVLPLREAAPIVPVVQPRLSATAPSYPVPGRKSALGFVILGVLAVLAPLGFFLVTRLERQPGLTSPGPTAVSTASLHELPPTPASTPSLPPAVHAFPLTISSSPPGALVTEHGQELGSTPLVLNVERQSVATTPRRFVITLSDYLPYTLEQGDSDQAVQATFVLTPIPPVNRPIRRSAGSNRPAARADSAPESVEFAPSKRNEPTELEIRLRR